VRLGLAGLVFAALAAGAQAEEVIPPSPPEHFNDYASIVSPATASSLDAELSQFERTTSNQLVVVIYPTMQSDSSVEDYTVRVAQSWHAGIKGKDNGAVLFIFAKTHQIYLQVGYGLEGSLPDATAKNIISDVIVPAFKQGDFDRGVTAGVHAIMAATRGEYHGSGRTVADRRSQQSPFPFLFAFVVIFVFIAMARSRAAMYQSSGRRGFGGMILPILLSGGGGGGGFGGGGGGGGGGFSGGGGSFGGGGAGGSW
jgi:uncharacterized protein